MSTSLPKGSYRVFIQSSYNLDLEEELREFSPHELKAAEDYAIKLAREKHLPLWGLSWEEPPDWIKRWVYVEVT